MKAAVVAAILLWLPPGARADCQAARAAVLPLTMWDQKLFIPVEIDGAELQLFIDTGAAVSTLSQTASDTLNLPRNPDHSADTFGVGGVESRLAIVEAKDVAIGGLQFGPHAFPVARFGEGMADGRPVGGLIGADILSRYDVELDVAGRRMALWQVSGCDDFAPDWPGKFGSVALEIEASHHASVPVVVDGASLELMIDTGSPGLAVSTRAAARAGAPPETLEEGRTLLGRGLNDRAFGAWLHVFGRVAVAGQVFGDVRAIVVGGGRRTQAGDGLLGLEFLKRGRVWLSYSTGRFFMQGPEP